MERELNPQSPPGANKFRREMKNVATNFSAWTAAAAEQGFDYGNVSRRLLTRAALFRNPLQSRDRKGAVEEIPIKSLQFRQ